MSDERINYRPGDKWKYVGSAVYEQPSGLRVHIGGMICRLPDGTVINGNISPICFEIGKLIRINGGNKKRALMAWANNLYTLRKKERELNWGDMLVDGSSCMPRFGIH